MSVEETPVRLFGIRNCDSVRKARQWLDRHAITYRFHDFRVEGVDRRRLRLWADRLGWERLLNRRGGTWRGLGARQRADLNRERAEGLMIDHPTLIKRPVLEAGDAILCGFDEQEYRTLLSTDVAQRVSHV